MCVRRVLVCHFKMSNIISCVLFLSTNNKETNCARVLSVRAYLGKVITIFIESLELEFNIVGNTDILLVWFLSLLNINNVLGTFNSILTCICHIYIYIRSHSLLMDSSNQLPSLTHCPLKTRGSATKFYMISSMEKLRTQFKLELTLQPSSKNVWLW